MSYSKIHVPTEVRKALEGESNIPAPVLSYYLRISEGTGARRDLKDSQPCLTQKKSDL